MSNTRNPRKQAGMWLVGILGLIFAALGIRYASSSGWWGNIFNPANRQALQTINTGVSVQIPAAQMTSTLNATPGNNSSGNTTLLAPNSNGNATTNGSNSSSQGKKMW